MIIRSAIVKRVSVQKPIPTHKPYLCPTQAVLFTGLRWLSPPRPLPMQDARPVYIYSQTNKIIAQPIMCDAENSPLFKCETLTRGPMSCMIVVKQAVGRTICVLYCV